MQKFISDYNLDSTKQLVHFITALYEELKPPHLCYSYKKHLNNDARPEYYRFTCDLTNPEDVRAMTLINEIYDKTNATTLSNAFWDIFSAVSKRLRALEKHNDPVKFASFVAKRKNRMNQYRFSKLRVGEYMTYRQSEASVQLLINNWMAANYEKGRRFKIVKDGEKINVYREL